MKMQKHTWILASASARRSEILQMLGLPFTVRPTDVDETLPDAVRYNPAAAVELLSARKAYAAYRDRDEIIIAADTVVWLPEERRILGKPADEADAFAMLRALSGNTHVVCTGITVKRGACVVTTHEESRVTFLALTDMQIARYIALQHPLDKAGAYGIQETASLFVSRIEGDYLNIVGLPACRLGEMLREHFGIELMDEILPERWKKGRYI